MRRKKRHKTLGHFVVTIVSSKENIRSQTRCCNERGLPKIISEETMALPKKM